MPEVYDEIIYSRYKFKRKTTAQWASLNPVLLAGEPGIEVLADESEKFKYGDGVKTWAQLSYAAEYGDGGPAAWWLSITGTTGRSLAGAATAADARTTLELANTSTPQFAGLGLGTAPVSGWELVTNGGMVQNRASLTANSGTYTLDVTVANEFATGAAIAGATTINLSNLANIPAGYLWRAVLKFSYSSGTISWFTGNSGYTVKWDGITALTPTAGETEKVVIEVIGGTTIIEVAPLKGSP